MTHRPVTIALPPPNDAPPVDAPQAEALLLTADAVAKLLSVSRLSVWRWRSAGKLPQPIKVGRTVRWRRAEIIAWIDAGCPNCRGPARR